jgi:hypothetical protein
MQECETSTESSFVKRVTVRTGGAGHAHSGVVKASISRNEDVARTANANNGKVVKLGR